MSTYMSLTKATTSSLSEVAKETSRIKSEAHL